jgi:hypothetical protein
MEAYILKDECYKIIGACMEIHPQLGTDFWNWNMKKL